MCVCLFVHKTGSREVSGKVFLVRIVENKKLNDYLRVG